MLFMVHARNGKGATLVRVAHALHRIAYGVWLRLLAARVALLIAALAILALDAVISRAHAAPTDDAIAKRQATILAVLTDDDLLVVKGIRGGCATGRQPERISSGRTAGLTNLPEAVDYCVAALTHLGRDGILGYVRDPSHDGLTSALAFDNGFVNAYLKHEAVPAGLPTMAALKAVGQRCLALSETDTDLCSSVGYAYGLRAAQGEVVNAS